MLQTKRTKLRICHGSNFIAYRPGAMRLAQKRGLKSTASMIAKVRKTIEANLAELRAGKVRTVEGITIKREFTGEYPGGANLVTLRVTIGKKSFFVKVCKDHPEKLSERYSKVEEFLKSIKHKFEGINVRLIKPWLILSKDKGVMFDRRTYVATDFVEKGKAETTHTYFGPNQKRVFDVTKLLDEALRDAANSYDTKLYNTYYDEKTNTIWIFDP